MEPIAPNAIPRENETPWQEESQTYVRGYARRRYKESKRQAKGLSRIMSRDDVVRIVNGIIAPSDAVVSGAEIFLIEKLERAGVNK